MFWFDADRVILGLENLEYANPGDMTDLTFRDAQSWDSQLETPQDDYDSTLSYEFGWAIVADQNGVYPARMGRAASRLYQIEQED